MLLDLFVYLFLQPEQNSLYIYIYTVLLYIIYKIFLVKQNKNRALK